VRTAVDHRAHLIRSIAKAAGRQTLIRQFGFVGHAVVFLAMSWGTLLV
jgi:hypothetical protein